MPRPNGQERARIRQEKRDAADTKKRMSKMASFGENYKRQEQEDAQRARAHQIREGRTPTHGVPIGGGNSANSLSVDNANKNSNSSSSTQNTGGESKETPAQKIKRLEKELEDERLRNLLLNEVVDILDAEHGAGLRKKLIAKELEAFKGKAK